MQPEDKILCACTRQRFLPEHQQTVQGICRQEAINWEVVFSTAVQHGVAALIYVNLKHCDPRTIGLPPEIQSKFERAYYHNIALMSGVTERLRQALAYFNKRTIDVLVIKGAALGILIYDQPWYTTPNDVDLILRVKREELPECDLLEFESHFKRTGIEYDFFKHHDITMNGVLPVDFGQIWDHAAKITCQEQAAYVMSPEDMLLSACINSCRKRFFRLKSLCDIAEILDRSPNLNWLKLIQSAQAYDCHNIVYAALLAVKITLGCTLPDQVVDDLDVNPGRSVIINQLSQRMSLASFSSLYPERSVFGRRMGTSLLLPYATYGWDHMWRKARFVLKTRSVRFIDLPL